MLCYLDSSLFHSLFTKSLDFYHFLLCLIESYAVLYSNVLKRFVV